MKACEIRSNPAAVHPQLWFVACASIQGTGEKAGGRVGMNPWASSY